MVEKFCCIVYRDDVDGPKFLLLHRDSWWSGWEFARGDITKNADVARDVGKTLSLSTGLNVANIRALPFNYNYSYLKGLNYVDASVSCFIAKLGKGENVASSEHSHYKWASFETAMKLLDFDEQKKLLESCYSNIMRS